MNIAEILKDCPKGTKLYSPVYGDVYLLYVMSTTYSIVVRPDSDNDFTVSFTSDGRLNANFNGECMLFPSIDNKDWSTFKVPKKEYKFKPFDKVLVRDSYDNVWQVDFFAYTSISDYKYQAMTGAWKQCIPFEGNEHLLGTSNPA